MANAVRYRNPHKHEQNYIFKRFFFFLAAIPVVVWMQRLLESIPKTTEIVCRRRDRKENTNGRDPTEEEWMGFCKGLQKEIGKLSCLI